MGVALRAGTVPHTGRPGFDLGEGEVELGIGIHGEPGTERVALPSADAVAERLLDAVLSDLEIGRAHV